MTDTALDYRRMAEHQLRGVSPSYEQLCLGVAGDAEVLTLVDELPPEKRQPNLVLAAVRYLGGPMSSWSAFRDFLVDRWGDVATVALARRTQTNEPRRWTAFVPALAGVSAPVALLEVGAAAGLCLYPDRFSYRYVSPGGDTVLGTGPELACEAAGPVPVTVGPPDVVWRAGLDLNPLDVTSDDDVRWLECLVWPEQTERVDILRAAVEIARADPPRLVTGDLRVDLLALAAEAPTGVPLVIFHSAVLVYVDLEGRRAFAESVAAVSTRRPVIWLANEGPGVVDHSAPRDDGPARFVLTRDGVAIARTGPHGQSLTWSEEFG